MFRSNLVILYYICDTLSWLRPSTSLATWPGDKESPIIHGTWMGRDADPFSLKTMHRAWVWSRIWVTSFFFLVHCQQIVSHNTFRCFFFDGSCLVVSCQVLPWIVELKSSARGSSYRSGPVSSTLPASASAAHDITWWQGHESKINMYKCIYLFIIYIKLY